LTIDRELLKKSVDELTDQLLNIDDKLLENSKFIQKLKKVNEEKDEVISFMIKIEKIMFFFGKSTATI